MPAQGEAFRKAVLAAAVLSTFLCGGCSDAPQERVISDSPREAIVTVHAVLLLPPPTDPMIDELFDYFELLSVRAATGEIDAHWAAYLYTNYYLDILRDRPEGVPRRSIDEMQQSIDADVEFYYIRKRPEARPSPIGAWVWQVAPVPVPQGQ